jgi:hypothetical protein
MFRTDDINSCIKENPPYLRRLNEVYSIFTLFTLISILLTVTAQFDCTVRFSPGII